MSVEELFAAVKRNDLESVDSLLKGGVDVDSVDSRYRCTALMCATECGHEEIVRLLLERGAKIDAVDWGGWTALMLADECGHEEIVRLLLERGAKIDAVKGYGWTALMRAARDGHEEIVRLLLERGVEIDAVKEDGWTALMLAVRDGHEKVVRLLLERGVEIDAVDRYGWTALMLAAKYGHEEIVRLLLERGVEIDAVDGDGWTALIYAAMGGHEKIVRLLLERGAKIDAVKGDGWTALIYAAMGGHEKVVRLLLERGAKIDAVDRDGRTALMYAVIYGRLDIVQSLLENEADVHAEDRNGKTALDFARSKKGIKEMLEKVAIMNWMKFKVFGGEPRSVGDDLIEKYDEFIRQEVKCFSQFNTQLLLHVLEHTPGLGEALREEKFAVYGAIRDFFADMGQICTVKARKFERESRYKEIVGDFFDNTILQMSPEDIFQRVNAILAQKEVSLEDALFAMHFIDHNHIMIQDKELPEIVQKAGSQEMGKELDILARLGLGVENAASKKPGSMLQRIIQERQASAQNDKGQAVQEERAVSTTNFTAKLNNSPSSPSKGRG